MCRKHFKKNFFFNYDAFVKPLERQHQTIIQYSLVSSLLDESRLFKPQLWYCKKKKKKKKKNVKKGDFSQAESK